MFNSDPSAKPAKTKLPKAVMMMVEKGNIVMAIKTLAADDNISMDAAKARIDSYEAELKAKQQQKLNIIANKQGIPNEALSFDRPPFEDESVKIINNHVKTTPDQQNFNSLQNGLDDTLNSLGYKKPLVPYWLKRLSIIVIIMLGLFWILWRIFG